MFSDMNRSEQESLYRAATNIRISGPQKNRLSHGSIRPFPSSPKATHLENSYQQDDLVLSVLKSPVNHIGGVEEDDNVDKQKDDEEEIDEDAEERMPFLQRLRGHRTPRFGEAHHKRVPTPIKRKQKNRRRSPEQSSAGEELVSADDLEDVTSGVEDSEAPRGVPDPYYPIYLPIDQAFKTKYVFQHKKGKTFQERLYVFLEHPGGWLCFIYHFTV